jgi:hypothetical protein
MWEVVTLGNFFSKFSYQIKDCSKTYKFSGGTPYPDVKTREIPMRVSRGLRLPQVNLSL